MPSFRYPKSLVASLLISGLPLALHGADATWNLNNPGNWNAGGNWSPAAAPGATSGTTNTDTVTFGSIITAARTVTVDTGRNIANIDFSGNSFAYNLSGGSLFLTAGGTLQTSGGGSAHTDLVLSPITLQGNYTFAANTTTLGRILQIGNASGTPIVTTGAASGTSTLTLTGASTDTNLIGGVISNGTTANLALLKTGTGLWRLNGNNTFTGGIVIQEGTLELNASSSSGGSSNAISVGNAAASGNATLNFSSFNAGMSGTQSLTIAANSLGGTRTVSSSVVSTSSGAVISAATTLNSNATFRTTNTGFLRFDTISGTGGATINSTGAGNVVYNNATNYQGATNVEAGTLFLANNGTIGSSSVLTVSSGAVIAGTGTVNGLASISAGGVVHAGNTVAASGTLKFSNNLTLHDGAILEFVLGAPGTRSQLQRTGGVWSFDSDQAFQFVDIVGTMAPGVYNDIIYGLTGSEAGLATINTWKVLNDGYTATFIHDGTTVDMVLATVPEPGVVVSALLGLVILGLRRRRP